MNILKQAVNSLSFSINLGAFLVWFPFVMIGFLFLSVLYLTLRLWISDIILKFLIECFTKDIVDMKDYPKKEKNKMNRYVSISLVISFILPFILGDFILSSNHMVYYLIQGSIALTASGLIYKNIKKQ